MSSHVTERSTQDNRVALPHAASVALAMAQQANRVYQRGDVTVVALQEATCTITPGDRIALVGRSGSGKSTLLHLLGGLDTPTSGTVSWPALGTCATLRPRKVAFVFQMPSLLPPLTVIENVELPLLLGGADASTARAAARGALDLMDLAALADQLPEELSGGQAQRVAMARALAYRPKLILADEPTGQLDRPTAQQLFDVLLAALVGTDTALVVATHDRTVAERLTQHWQMRHGVLEGATQ
jgi:ABC-type lipoprotein export system ATPase subunit